MAGVRPEGAGPDHDRPGAGPQEPHHEPVCLAAQGDGAGRDVVAGHDAVDGRHEVGEQALGRKSEVPAIEIGQRVGELERRQPGCLEQALQQRPGLPRTAPGRRRAQRRPKRTVWRNSSRIAGSFS